MTKQKAKTRAQLERENMELRAQLAHVYYHASRELPKAGQKHLMASGVVLQLHALGGRQIVLPVLIRDGLSDDTIAALQRDFVRSYDGAVLAKPAIK